jgi:hypothetical protein
LPLRRVLSGGRPWARPDADIVIDVVTPPYPCVGTGELRLIRFAESEGTQELTAAYEGYDRLAESR